jgi:hypothetical protein
MQPKPHGSYNPEVTATAAQSPKQIGVGKFIGRHARAIGQHDLSAQ